MEFEFEREEARPCGLDAASIREIASSMTKTFGYRPGGSVEAVINATGGVVERKWFWNLPHGPRCAEVEIDGENDYTVYISSDTTVDRDTRTLAAGFGSYVLHWLWPHHVGEPVGPVWRSRYATGQIKFEVDVFSAEFLMPQKAFVPLWREAERDGKDPAVAASRAFNVGPYFAQKNAEGLGLAPRTPDKFEAYARTG